jgi:hypothetical protein
MQRRLHEEDTAGTGQGKLHWAIHIADQTGMTCTAVLHRAVRDGRIPVHISQPENAQFKDRAKTTARQPAVALIGDDDGLRRGAAAWGGFAYGMVRWASHVMVHACGAEAAPPPGGYCRRRGRRPRLGDPNLPRFGAKLAPRAGRDPTSPGAGHLTSRRCPSGA